MTAASATNSWSGEGNWTEQIWFSQLLMTTNNQTTQLYSWIFEEDSLFLGRWSWSVPPQKTVMEIASVRVHFVFDFYISDTSHSAAVDRLLAQSRSCSSEERKGLRNDPHNCSTRHSLSWSARANHVKHSIDVTRSPHQTFIRINSSHPHDLRKNNPEQAQAFKVYILN